MIKRTASEIRNTRETQISIEVNLDGTGVYSIETGLPFLNHMLELFSRHSLIDLQLKASGDLAVDYHHTVEDVGLALGTAIDRALGDRKGIRRYGFFYIPMDEALCRVVVDLGGRPFLVKNMACKKEKLLDFELALFDDFFQAFVVQARMNLHIEQILGQEAHHAYESVFKALARAMRMALEADPRDAGIPSSKGRIGN
ncbi:MAG TPA: imidazoleglycerol-phosphate dehydratase HisB [Verrucomicrobia bacterium]|nr:imidazoleglycerol-phosphate dehydratase HisB [Verrucomicrobiota bacterium]